MSGLRAKLTNAVFDAGGGLLFFLVFGGISLAVIFAVAGLIALTVALVKKARKKNRQKDETGEKGQQPPIA